MNARNKAKIKDGLWVGLMWLIVSVISDWRELHTPILAKGALIGDIVGSVLLGLIFGLSFRPLFGFTARHISEIKKGKTGERRDVF